MKYFVLELLVIFISCIMVQQLVEGNSETEATAGVTCLTDEDCQVLAEDLDLICKNITFGDVGICTCPDTSYHLRYFEEIKQYLCIEFDSYGDRCDSDYQCNYYDSNMECDSFGLCNCEYGYYYDYYYDYCLYNPWTAYLSVTAVIGIVFGVILLVILIMTAFALCLRPKMLGRSRPPPPPTTVENQFSSFNEPSVIWTAGDDPTFHVDGPPNYTEAGGLDTPPPPFESEIVIKTRLEDPPVDNSNNRNPFQQQPQQQLWFEPSQVQEQRPDLYTPEYNTSPAPQNPLNSNDQFFFQNPNYQSNVAFEEDC